MFRLTPLACGFYLPLGHSGGGATSAPRTQSAPRAQSGGRADCADCACALDRAADDTATVCYNTKELRRIARREGLAPTGDDKTALVAKIHKKLKATCGDNQVCWANDDPELLRAYKPLVPDGGKFTWLNTTNIEQVGAQLEAKFKDFKFLGTVAIDFKDYHPRFRDFQLADYVRPKGGRKPRYTTLGVVFNTDPHFESGQHWISMFVDLDKKLIIYFDSYGDTRNTPTEVDDLAELMQSQAQHLGMDLEYRKNPTRFQRKDSECGVYCLYFLTKCLEGVDFSQFIAAPISDDEVNTYRVQKGHAAFFRHPRVPLGPVSA